MGRYYVDQYTGRLERTDVYLVRLIQKDGTVQEDLEPRMLFPFSNQTMYITLLDKNEREVGFVRDLEEIDAASRQALEECFREYYMIPKIKRLISCVEKFGALEWKVETDRGVISFRIRSRHSDIKHLGRGHRLLIRDANDNRYEIPDYTTLDARSASLLYQYL